MLLENIDLKKQTVFVCSERHDGPIKVSLFVLNIIYIHLISRYLRVKYGILVDLIQEAPFRWWADWSWNKCGGSWISIQFYVLQCQENVVPKYSSNGRKVWQKTELLWAIPSSKGQHKKMSGINQEAGNLKVAENDSMQKQNYIYIKSLWMYTRECK